jgi:hypothetical protein
MNSNLLISYKLYSRNIPYCVGKSQWRFVSFYFWNFIPQIYTILIFIICINGMVTIHYESNKCWLNIPNTISGVTQLSTTSASSSDTTNHTWFLRLLQPDHSRLLYLPLIGSILYLPTLSICQFVCHAPVILDKSNRFGASFDWTSYH